MFTYGTIFTPRLFTTAPSSKGIYTLTAARSLNQFWAVMFTWSVQIMAVMPRAKNMPAMVTMKGWIPR